MSTTILTPEQIETLFREHDDLYAFGHAIAAAVLQSEQVQRWKRDTERIYDIENERILVGPEYQGGWVAYVFKNEDTPVGKFQAESFREVVDAAMEKQP